MTGKENEVPGLRITTSGFKIEKNLVSGALC